MDEPRFQQFITELSKGKKTNNYPEDYYMAFKDIFGVLGGHFEKMAETQGLNEKEQKIVENVQNDQRIQVNNLLNFILLITFNLN